MNFMTAGRTALRTCPLCEATCGLEITLRARGLLSEPAPASPPPVMAEATNPNGQGAQDPAKVG